MLAPAARSGVPPELTKQESLFAEQFLCTLTSVVEVEGQFSYLCRCLKGVGNVMLSIPRRQQQRHVTVPLRSGVIYYIGQQLVF